MPGSCGNASTSWISAADTSSGMNPSRTSRVAVACPCSCATALDIATERLDRSRELAQAADRTRQDIAANLGRLREELAELPELLAQPDDSEYSVLSDADDLDLLNSKLSPEARSPEARSNA